MKPDPGLEATRRAREEISHEHDNDPKRLVEYFMEYQRRFSDRLRWSHGGDEVATTAEQDAAADGATRRS